MSDLPERDLESVILDLTILVSGLLDDARSGLVDDAPTKAVKDKIRALSFEAHDFGARAAWAEVAELIAEHRP